MKNQTIFSSKDKSKKLKCRLLQFLFSALRVNGRLLQFLFSALRVNGHITLAQFLRIYLITIA